jgi:predicted DsbA family dithiol-disulfide isomerase
MCCTLKRNPYYGGRADHLRAAPERLNQIRAGLKGYVRLRVNFHRVQKRDQREPADLIDGRENDADQYGAIREIGDARERDERGRGKSGRG